MKALLRFAVPVAGLLAFAGGAEAQTPSMLDVLAIDASGDNPEAVFTILDANGDGTVSRVELRLRKYSVFFVKDGNRDGKISVDEYGDARLLRFDSIDADGDGRVTVAELKSFRKN